MPKPLQAWRAHKPLAYALIIGLTIAALGVATGGRPGAAATTKHGICRKAPRR